MKYHYKIALGLTFILAGCATEKTLDAIGGSRSDGMVKLAFSYNLFEKPEVNWSQALATAEDRCHAWGYSGAEKFGGGLSQCTAMNGYGNCMQWTVTVSYQCTGHPG